MAAAGGPYNDRRSRLMSTALSSIDFLLLGLYLVGTMGLGLWIGRSIRTGDDFFLGGRRLPWAADAQPR